MVRRRSTVRFRNGAPARTYDSKIWTLGSESRWGLTAARRRHGQPASASPARPCRQLRQCPGSPARSRHGGEGAGDGRAGITPRPGGPGARSRAIVWCRAVYRIPPGLGRGHRLGHGARTSGGCGTAPGPGSEASGPRPRAAAYAGAQAARGESADRAGKPGRSLAPSPPGAHSCVLSGLDIPVVCARPSRGAARRGTDLP